MSEELWVDVLKAKYNCGNNDLPSFQKGRTPSNLWRGGCASWEKVKANVVWRIGNGNYVMLRTDLWVPTNGILQPYALNVLSCLDIARFVSFFCLNVLCM